MTNRIFLLVILVSLSACSAMKTESPDTADLSYLYNPILNRLHPRYRVFNDNNSTSTLSVQLFTNEIQFNEANPDGVPRASLVFFYRLYNLSEGRVPVDTAFYNLPVDRQENRRDYVFNFPMNAPEGARYEIELLIRDVLRNATIQAHIQFDKQEGSEKHQYKIRGHFNRYEIFTPVLRDGDYINIMAPNLDADSLYVRYFKPYDRVPDPPSMLVPERALSLEPDRQVTILLSDTLPVMFPDKGVYLFTSDSASLNGTTIFNFGPTYPTMDDPAVMIPPLAYLAGPQGAADMLKEENLKIALDNFWLGVTNNVERSRELVRIYYNRVLYANYFFASYKEGWLTDRGMIYIIYGPPDKVYKTNEGERWGYRKPVVKSGWGMRYRLREEYLYFSFVKRENPFTYNDYTLLRSESVTTYWDQAIRSWMSGIVFRLDNPEDL